MEKIGSSVDSSRYVVKKRGKIGANGGCLVCGEEPAVEYCFHCVKLVARDVKTSNRIDYKVTSTYQIDKTIFGKLCSKCIRLDTMMGIRNISIAFLVGIIIFVGMVLFHINLLFVPIIILVITTACLITELINYNRKKPTQEQGDTLLSFLLEAKHPGYNKYMTRKEWDDMVYKEKSH